MGRKITPEMQAQRDALAAAWRPLWDAIDAAVALHNDAEPSLTVFGIGYAPAAGVPKYWVQRRLHDAMGCGVNQIGTARVPEAVVIVEAFIAESKRFYELAKVLPSEYRAGARMAFFRGDFDVDADPPGNLVRVARAMQQQHSPASRSVFAAVRAERAARAAPAQATPAQAIREDDTATPVAPSLWERLKADAFAARPPPTAREGPRMHQRERVRSPEKSEPRGRQSGGVRDEAAALENTTVAKDTKHQIPPQLEVEDELGAPGLFDLPVSFVIAAGTSPKDAAEAAEILDEIACDLSAAGREVQSGEARETIIDCIARITSAARTYRGIATHLRGVHGHAE